MNHAQRSAVAVLLAAASSLTLAQDYPLEAQMKFEAWDGSAWVRDITVDPGARIEWRARIDYTGPRTDLFAIGEVLYQPVVSNADNIGTGNDADQFGAFRNGGVSGNAIPNSILSTAEGESGLPNPDGYGRVRFGQTAMNTSSNRVLTTFRHNGGSNGAPPGEWMRLAGSGGVNWPRINPDPTMPGSFNNYSIPSQQVSLALTNPPSLHTPGVHDITIFRMQIDLADSNVVGRRLVMTSPPEAFKRAGGPTSTDNRRYMSFQSSNTDNGSYRVQVDVLPLTINVVPAPGALAPLAGLLLLCSRRNRKESAR